MAKAQAQRKYMITREKYKAIKKFDHAQMESFCEEIHKSGYMDGYEIGYQAGYTYAATEEPSESVPDESIELDVAGMLEKIGNIKGIGPKKLDEIREIVKEALHG